MYMKVFPLPVERYSHQAAPHPEIPEVTQSEVRHALNRMPNGKASGPDDISVETLKAGGASLDQQLASLYTKCLKENKIPKSWKSSKMVLIHKKGDNKDLKNYRLNSLLSNVYSLHKNSNSPSHQSSR